MNRSAAADSVIVAAGRSPIGRAWKGSLIDLRPDDLAATIVEAVLAQVPELGGVRINDIIAGCAEPQDEHGGNIARRISVILGLDDVPGTTVIRACASSTQALRMAHHAIQAGEGDLFVCVGVEMVSRYQHRDRHGKRSPSYNPRFAAARARSERTAATGEHWHDPRSDHQMPDIYIAMGQTAENVAVLRGITREEQDAFAMSSQHRAQDAIAAGFFAGEIVPIMLPDGSIVSSDDGPRTGVTMESLAALPAVFRPNGTVTAGNSCPLNDGAAAVVVMSRRLADKIGARPRARIIATAVTGLSPEIMGLGPVRASEEALHRAGLTVGDLDLVEINEAFAVQALASIRALGLDPDRVNAHGGAIALGHPYGMTGVRIMTTLLNGLEQRSGRYGLETLCVGGGQGMAVVIERLA